MIQALLLLALISGLGVLALDSAILNWE